MPRSPWYPLPPDFPELTAEGQKDARRAVVQDLSTPTRMVEAWSFFRDYYLAPDDTGAIFYRGSKKLPSPQFHAQMVYELGMYDLNVWAAPRGSAKSVVLGTEVPLLFLLAKPQFETAIMMATEKRVEERFDHIMQQLEDNEYIRDDFGRMRPKRGEGVWSRSLLRLTNGAILSGYPILGRKRGFRPQLFILDDPEFDPRQSTDIEKLHEEFEELLFKVILPALDEGARLFWLGTMISRRLFLYYACTSEDPRFKYWNRRILKAVDGPLVEGNTHLLWPEKWSVPRLQQIQARIGNAAFSSEFQNNPISAVDRTFQLDPQFHYYFVESNDTLTTFDLAKGLIPDPLTCNYPLIYYDKKEQPFSSSLLLKGGSEDGQPAAEAIRREATYSDLILRCFRLMTVDYGATGKRGADYCCAHVMGLDHENNLWSFDMYLGRPLTDNDFRRIVYSLALHWRVKLIGVENIAKQIELEQSIRDYFTVAATTTGWLPRVVGVGRGKSGYRFIEKGERIASLTWRFNRGRIKIPGHRIGIWPYSTLMSQIENFTPDLKMLVNDDAIDTMGMVSYMIGGKGHNSSPDADRMDWDERIMRGEVTDATGMPLTAGVDPTKLSPNIIKKILDIGTERSYTEDPRKKVRTIRQIFR